MIELTSEEKMLLRRLQEQGPQRDRDCTPERVLINSGLAYRQDPGLIAISEAGKNALAR